MGRISKTRRPRWVAGAGFGGLGLALGLAACSGGAELSDAARRGRGVYAANCTACHAANPAADGPLGPAVAGSSRELLEARLVHGTYPPGYTPKRETAVMAALPHLADSIDDLAAYLQEVE